MIDIDETEKFQISWFDAHYHVEFFGDILARDVEQANQEIFNDNRFYQPHLCSIWDFTQCDVSKVEKEEVLISVAFDLGASRMVPHHCLAHVATDPYSKFLCQYYATHMNIHDTSWEIKVFSTIPDAKEWLDGKIALIEVPSA